MFARRSTSVLAMSSTSEVINTVIFCVLNNLVIIAGIIGNLLAVFILSHTKLLRFKSPFHKYLLALAISDLLFLLPNLAYSICACRGIYTPAYISRSHMEATALMVLNPLRQLLTGPSDLVSLGMTLQRVLVMARVPLPGNTQGRVFLTTILMAYLISTFLNLPLFWAFKLDPKPCPDLNTTTCYNSPVLGKPFLVTFDFWSTFEYVYVAVMKIVPAVGLLIMNLYLIRKVRNILKKKRLLQCKPTDPHKIISSDPNATVNVIDSISTLSFTLSEKTSNEQQTKRSKKLQCAIYEIRLTIVLIAILTSYSLLTTLNTVVTIFWFSEFDITNKWDHGAEFVPWLSSVGNLLLSCNYSINLYLFCATNGDFRRALTRILMPFRGYV